MKTTTLALTAALLVSTSGTVFAKDPTDGKSENLAIDKMICQQLYIHKPDADVNYKAGVDVNGNAVAPADLPADNSFVAAPGDYIEVPITVDLAQRLDQPVPEGVKLDGVIGNLRLYKDGRINYDGRDVLPQASTMCGNQLKVVSPTTGALEVAPIPGNEQFRPTEAPLAGATAPSATSNPIPPTPPEMAKGTSPFPNKAPTIK